MRCNFCDHDCTASVAPIKWTLKCLPLPICWTGHPHCVSVLKKQPEYPSFPLDLHPIYHLRYENHLVHYHPSFRGSRGYFCCPAPRLQAPSTRRAIHRPIASANPTCQDFRREYSEELGWHERRETCDKESIERIRTPPKRSARDQLELYNPVGALFVQRAS